MKILLAIDDSKSSEAAIQAVISQTQPNNTEVFVLHVVSLIPFYFTSAMVPTHSALLDAILEDERKEAQALVTHAEQVLRSAGFKATSAVREGDPKSIVIDLAVEWHADLIVLGSHGRKAIDRFMLGSVSDAVARHAPCSVEIVRVPAQAGVVERAA
jgi:nucleotide-binding universal stress UspA family protein